MSDPLDETLFREPSALDDSDDDIRHDNHSDNSDNDNDIYAPSEVRGVNYESEPLRGYGNTGVKGVLADYREAKQNLMIKNEYEKQRLYEQAKKNSFTVKSSREEEEEKKELENIDDDDEEFFRKYREKKIQQWRDKQTKKFGELKFINRDQFINEIEKELPNVFIVVHLFDPESEVCERVNEELEIIAQNFADVKFLKAISYDLKPDWDPFALPSLLIYQNGKYVNSLIRITQEIGFKFKRKDIEILLAKEGVIDVDY